MPCWNDKEQAKYVKTYFTVIMASLINSVDNNIAGFYALSRLFPFLSANQFGDKKLLRTAHAYMQMFCVVYDIV